MHLNHHISYVYSITLFCNRLWQRWGSRVARINARESVCTWQKMDSLNELRKKYYGSFLCNTNISQYLEETFTFTCWQHQRFLLVYVRRTLKVFWLCDDNFTHKKDMQRIFPIRILLWVFWVNVQSVMNSSYLSLFIFAEQLHSVKFACERI